MLVRGTSAGGGSFKKKPSTNWISKATVSGPPRSISTSKASSAYENRTRGNYGPVNDSPWRGSSVRQPVTTNYVAPAGGYFSGLNNWSNQMQSQGGIFGGGGSSGGSSSSAISRRLGGGGAKAPKAPKTKELTYKQLLNRAKNDPTLLKLLPFLQAGINDERSMYTERTGRARKDYDLGLSGLSDSEQEDQRALREEMAARGTIQSSAYGNRRERQGKEYTRQRGQLGNSLEGLLSELLSGKNTNIRNFQLQRSQAQNDAVQRLLADRTNLRLKR